MNSVARQLRLDFAPVRTRGRHPRTWFKLARRLRRLNHEVDAIRPPRAAARVNSALVAGLAALPGEAARIGRDLKRGNKHRARTDAIRLEGSLLNLYESITKALAG